MQLDVKLAEGLSKKQLCESVERGWDGVNRLLEEMDAVKQEPRPHFKVNY